MISSTALASSSSARSARQAPARPALTIAQRVQHERQALAFFRSHQWLLTDPRFADEARRQIAVHRTELAHALVLQRAKKHTLALQRKRLARRLSMTKPETPQNVICRVFGSYCHQALQVSRCESRFRTDAHNGSAKHGLVMGSFFLIWTAVWASSFVLTCVIKIDKGPVLAVLVAIVVLLGCYCFLALNNHGWESNHTLAISLGGGIGWVMMLNVWGVIWRFQKKIIAWTKANAANGTPIPDAAKALARQAFLASRTNAWLSLPMLFLMGASSHYPMFGR